jgi:hypothetical protein
VEIPAVVFYGGAAMVAIIAIIVRSQRSAVAGVASLERARADWLKLRPAIARHLETAEYRTASDGSKRLTAFGGQVGRIVAVQNPRRVFGWASMLPDADLHAVSELIDAHQALRFRGMAIEALLTTVVRSRVRTPEERRIMARAFRRWVLGGSEAEISRLLVDGKVSAKRRAAASTAVAAGIALVDERGELGEQTELFVAALERADAAYREARALLRG